MVVDELNTLDPTGEQFGEVVRETFDQLYDGQRTGRYKWAQLSKTERAHYGSLIEINLQRRFRFSDGVELDFQIAGVDIDCKFSESGAWMIPPISFDRLALVVKARDETGLFSVGVVRASVAHRNSGSNWDKKVTLSSAGRAAIHWFVKDHAIPPNVLASLSEPEIAIILAGTSGQQRIFNLLRVVQGRRITSNVVATVAQQKDFMRRLRDGGGARNGLRNEGHLVVMGDYSAHLDVAAALGTELPRRGEVVSVRVVPAEAPSPTTVLLDGTYWRVARADEHVAVPAPLLPTTRRSLT
jgi:hypothetical protein